MRATVVRDAIRLGIVTWVTRRSIVLQATNALNPPRMGHDRLRKTGPLHAARRTPMSQPIVFISHGKVKDGKLEGLIPLLRDREKRLEAEKPRTLASLAYLGNDGQLTIFHIFADADSFDLHLQGAEERLRGFEEFAESGGLEIYGTPSDMGMSAMGQSVASRKFLAGFLRLTPG
jgi:hypothetical protein